MAKRVTKNTYYKNELYISHAKPSITSDVTTVSAELDDFILEYERECLVKCLGLQLAKEFISQLDDTKANGLVAGADAKWNDLLNGKTYTNPSGEVVEWLGIRRKDSKDSYTISFLANYVYYQYEQNYDIFRSGIGNVKGKVNNTVEKSPAPKAIRAWRKMVDIIQGKEFDYKVIERPFGIGVDWYHDDIEVSLYRFIKDINLINPDTYANFKPSYWEVRNQFGI